MRIAVVLARQPEYYLTFVSTCTCPPPPTSSCTVVSRYLSTASIRTPLFVITAAATHDHEPAQRQHVHSNIAHRGHLHTARHRHPPSPSRPPQSASSSPPPPKPQTCPKLSLKTATRPSSCQRTTSPSTIGTRLCLVPTLEQLPSTSP